MHRWSLSETSACGSGSEVQTYTHIQLECPIWIPPCHLTEVDNSLLQNYLHKCNFWPESFFFSCFSLFIRIYISTEELLLQVKLNAKSLICYIYENSKLPTFQGFCDLKKRAVLTSISWHFACGWSHSNKIKILIISESIDRTKIAQLL